MFEILLIKKNWKANSNQLTMFKVSSSSAKDTDAHNANQVYLKGTLTGLSRTECV